MNTVEKDIAEFISSIISAWEKKDLKTCKERLKHLCNHTPPDFLRKVFGENSEEMMEWYIIFNSTGLPEEPDGTPSRKAFIDLNSYICNCDNPRIKKALDDAFKRCFPDLTPCGYDEVGDLYSLNDLAKALQVSPDKLLKEAKNSPDIKKGLRAVDMPGDNETIH